MAVIGALVRADRPARGAPCGDCGAPQPAAHWKIVVAMVAGALLGGAILYSLFEAAMTLKTLTAPELISTLRGAAATWARVIVSLLIAAAWTIPAGVAIGFNPKLARFAQPFAQVAASVPATALFPVLLLALIRMGGGLGVGSILLMLLGTQWYVLFNVIAGAMAIPYGSARSGGCVSFRPVGRAGAR